jgi:RHS repeat-associated protein
MTCVHSSPSRFRSFFASPRLSAPSRRAFRVLPQRVAQATVLLISVTSFAQGGPPAGIVPGSTQVPGSYESLDLASSNISIRIPVRSKSGKIPFSFNLIATSAMNLSGGSPNSWFSEMATGQTAAGPGGALTAIPATTIPIALDWVPSNCSPNCTDINFSVADAIGAFHPISNLAVKCPSSATIQATTSDALFTVVMSGCSAGGNGSYTIYDVSGNSYISFPNLPSGAYLQIQDPDGATITETSQNKSTVYEDSLSATPIVGWANSSANSITYTDAAGNPQTFQINNGSYTIQTAFGCSSVRDIAAGSATLPSSITTPTGNISFTYETTQGDTHTPHYTTGRIASITYPTGGSVTYAYSGGNNGINCNSGTIPTLTKTLNDGQGHLSTWTYVNTNNSATPGNFTVTVTDPANNQTVYNFAGEFQTQMRVYEGSATGTPLETVVTCYNGSNSSQGACITPSSVPSFPFSQTDVYAYLGSSSRPSLSETKYDAHLNVTSVSNYDFGATFPPSGSPLYSTSIAFDYPAVTGGSYPCGTLSVPMFNRPCTVTTSNSSVSYTYNSTGHPITMSRVVSGSATLASSATYASNGVITSIKDVNTATTQFSNGPSVGACNGLLPVGTTYPANAQGQLATTQAWDCNNAVVTSSNDPNQKASTYGFALSSVADPYYRPLSFADPLGNVTNYTYSPTSLESAMNFNGTASTADTLTTTDGLGRQIFAQIRQGQGPSTTTFDSSQTQYGWTQTTSTVAGGAFTKVSVPYSGTQGQSSPTGTPVTKTQYDALGRRETTTDGGGGTVSYQYTQNDVLVTLGPAAPNEATKQRQMEYDGLGRLTSVCEITSAAGSATCGQTNAKTGYWTRYKYDGLGHLLGVCQNTTEPLSVDCTKTPSSGQQTRTYVYDDLGRLTSETNPESGTATYTYDSDSSGTCPGTSKGDLIKRIDNIGNVTCFTYDGLHRKLSTTYSGSNATTNRYFVYDAATVNSQTMANAKGRLAEAYTATNATGTKITDEGFSYTARGELANFFESTPNSGGYYSVSMSYWANGLRNTVGPFLTDPQITITPDGEGRMNTVTNDGSNVKTIQYNPASQPTQINTSCAGSTCYPVEYQYDPNTLRMTQYSAVLNGGTISGALTWNPNGSLQQQVITDPFNSADSQTCTYGADDLSRIASVNCTSGSTNVWAQNFTYDAFGNITKTVPGSGTGISWNPGYSASTNHYALGGTSYDANGDVLNDTFNKYTWDAEGKPLSTAYSEGSGQTFTFVYDAFGHKVEYSINGTYESSYVTLGNIKFSAIGQTPGYSEFPAPGGAIISEGGGGTGVNLADWLGTVRAFYSYTGGNLAGTPPAHAPFGESYLSSGNPSDFTGQQSDKVTTNTTYYFPERQYRSSQGRWLSPDPAGLAAVGPSNPQTWNRYGYVANQPLNLVDPLGLWGDCAFYVQLYDENEHPSGIEGYFCGGNGGNGGAGGGGGAAPNSNNNCISVSSLKGSAVIAPGWYASYLASRAGAWLTGGTIGVGVGGGAGLGFGPKISVGGGISASAVFETDGLGNSALVLSFSPQFGGLNEISGDVGAAANIGVQVTVSESLVPTTLTPGANFADASGSIGPVGFDIQSGSASLQLGLGAGARVGVSVGPSVSISIPICKK